MTIWDKDLKLRMASEQSVQRYGLSNADEFITRFNELSPEYQPCGILSSKKAIDYVIKTLKEGTCTFEWMHQTLSGEPLPTEVTLVRFAQKGKPYVAGFAKDKRPEIQARERELENAVNRRLQSMIEAIPLGCCIADESLNVLDCNNATVELFGLKDKQEYIDRFHDLFPEYQPCGELSKAKFEKLVDKTFTEGPINFEWMHQTLDGEPIPTEVHLVHSIVDGKPVKIGYLRDLRDFKKYQEAEREANDRMNLMINTIPLVVTYWGADHSLKGCNQFALDFYGKKTLEEDYEQVYSEVLKDTIWFDKLDEIFETGSASFIFEDGKHNFWEMEGVRTTYNGEDVVVNYGKNITRLQELQAEQRRREVAEESNRAKTMFIANMSHEIRTPINSILGYSELALGTASITSTHEYLERIVSNSKWLIDIVNDVLDISKIESGLLELEEIPFSIHNLAERCQSLILPSAREKDVNLNFNVESSNLNGKQLLGDPTKICQVCTNILSNAIKFTNNGGAVVANFAISELDNGMYSLKFESRDTGIGMTQDQTSRIFDPFMQADSSTTRKYGGSGLGLAIVKRLVEAMGGELQVQSTPGLGSKFSFTINVTAKVIEKSTFDSPSGKTEILTMPVFEKNEVLVVDDNDMNLGVASEHLRRVGLIPTVATNGKMAIEKVKQRIDTGEAPFALILMDIHMPAMDGKEAASVITGFNIGTPIVAMTAETSILTEDALYANYGMDGYLSKPFTSQEIWHCLLKYLKPIVTADNNNQSNPKLDNMVDEELLKEMKTLFAQGSQNTVVNISKAIAIGDIKEAHRLAHTLKSSAMLIGKARLSKLAKDAESLLKSGAELPPELFSELELEHERVLDELRFDATDKDD